MQKGKRAKPLALARASIGAVLLLLGCTVAFGADRTDIWDIPPGISATEADANFRFVDHACGDAGGAPSRRLVGFSDFIACRPEASGLREVYFRYDDEAELMARALEQSEDILAHAGTTEFDYPIVASLLIGEDGIVRGKRLVTDPRPESATTRARFEFWTLGNLFRARWPTDAWSCEEAPLGDDRPVGRYAVNSVCALDSGGVHHIVRQLYLQRSEQRFIRPGIGRYSGEAYDSSTWIELVLSDVGDARP